MLIQGNEDLRVQKTMACIDRAFCELMLERDYGDITVAELCRRARIQRKTFYVYYASIDELLREKLGEVSRRYIERISRYAVPEQIAEVNLEFYRYSAEQGELYERIVCSAAPCLRIWCAGRGRTRRGSGALASASRTSFWLSFSARVPLCTGSGLREERRCLSSAWPSLPDGC